MCLEIKQNREESANKKKKREKIAHKIDDKPFQIIFSSLTLGGRGNARWKLLGTRLRCGMPNSSAQDLGRGNTLKSEGKMMNYLLPLSLGVKVSPVAGALGDGMALSIG